MPRLITLWIVFLFAFSNSSSQDHPLDSLKDVLAKTKVKDSNYVNLLYNIASTLWNKGDLNGATAFASEGVELAKKINWDRGAAMGYMGLSDLKGSEAKYDSAAEDALNALRISEKMHNEEFVMSCNSILSNDYRLLGNDSLGKYYAVKYLEGANHLKNERSILSALLNLSNIYRDEGEEDKSQELLDRALKMPNVKDDKMGLAGIYQSKGIREDALGRFASAIDFYKQELSLRHQLGDLHWEAYTMAIVSRTYSKWGKKDSASFYAYAALDLSKRNDMKKEIRDAYSALFFFHKTFGDYKKALDYLQLFDSMYNETYNLQVAQNSERTRLKFEQEKKDILAKQEQEIRDNATRKTRNLQYGIIGGFMLLAVFLFWNNRQKQKSNRKIEKAYTELRATQSQLIQSEKMASLGQLTAGIAHEIQNPLNFVNNFSEVNAELLLEMQEEISKGNYNEALAISGSITDNEQKILSHGRRADAIVKGMLQHSRNTSGHKEPTDINALAEEYIRLCYHGMRTKDQQFSVTIKTDFDPSLSADAFGNGKINIIPQDIGKVLLNLYNNAFYAAQAPLPPKGTPPNPPEGGKELNYKHEPIVWVSTKKIGEKVFISIKDNGHGIPEKILDKIFQPFFTTKPTGQGTGLGLSLSYDIIKAHGGELKVKTKEGEGAEFIIELPL